jgi:hypothetical protein
MRIAFFKHLHKARALTAWWVLCAVLGLAYAQAAEPLQPADPAKAVGQQQKRAALRAALRAQRDAEGPRPDRLEDRRQERPARQLSTAERAKLRDQLRQQRREGPPARQG